MHDGDPLFHWKNYHDAKHWFMSKPYYTFILILSPLAIPNMITIHNYSGWICTLHTYSMMVSWYTRYTNKILPYCDVKLCVTLRKNGFKQSTYIWPSTQHWNVYMVSIKHTKITTSILSVKLPYDAKLICKNVFCRFQNSCINSLLFAKKPPL